MISAGLPGRRVPRLLFRKEAGSEVNLDTNNGSSILPSCTKEREDAKAVSSTLIPNAASSNVDS